MGEWGRKVILLAHPLTPSPFLPLPLSPFLPLPLSPFLPLLAIHPLRLHIPRRFDPAHSLLGRAVRRAVADPRRAQALYWVLLVGLALGLLLAGQWAWALRHEALAAGSGAVLFWGVQAGAWLLLTGTGLVGFQPGAVVVCTERGLHLRQGARRLELPYDAVESIETITPLRFHRREGRYAGTHVFATHLRHDLLLLRTARGPVVLGLRPEEQEAVRVCIRRRQAASQRSLAA